MRLRGELSATLSFLRTFGLILVLVLILPEFMGVTGIITLDYRISFHFKQGFIPCR